MLSTGTVSGVAGFSPDAASLYLKPGDVIEAEIERIGVLRNPVISWQEGHGEPPPDTGALVVLWPRDDAKLERMRALLAERSSTRSSSARPTTSST